MISSFRTVPDRQARAASSYCRAVAFANHASIRRNQNPDTGGAMPTRREFVRNAAGAMAGIAFVGCGLLDARDAQAQAGGTVRRREVVVSGRRVKTVDVHAHCAVPEAMALMGLKVEPKTLIMEQDRIRAMDEQGIDVEALSINPYWYKAERDLARALVKIQNEKLAELCASQPDRFVAFATVALQYPDLAAEQLEEGVKKLGLRGGSIGARVNGGLTNVIGNPLETTIALSHLIFEGTLDRFPGLKICAAHGGGYLPSYAARSDAGCVTFPERCAKVSLKKRPTEYLRQLYYDSIVFTPEALRHLAAEVGSGQIIMGTDYPFPWTKTSVDHILDTPGLSEAERAAMLGGTASRLLGIKS